MPNLTIKLELYAVTKYLPTQLLVGEHFHKKEPSLIRANGRNDFCKGVHIKKLH